MNFEPDEHGVDTGHASKTRRKSEAHELQALGVALAALNASQLQRVPMPEELRDALLGAQRIKTHEARRRQLQYIGKLMRNIDAEPLAAMTAKLAEWHDSSSEATATLHRIETWRERLIAQPAAMGEFADAYPRADLQHLRTQVRNAQREREQQKPPRHYRALFQTLKTIIAP
jgi:ribosome-associated protein